MSLSSSAGEVYPTSYYFNYKILIWLKQHISWIIANTDKNLGPCAIELNQYIQDALVRLQDSAIYEFLTEAEATAEAHR